MIAYNNKILSEMLKKLLSCATRSLSQNTKYQDTIFALATGVNTAISIVRVGGPQAYKAFQLLYPNYNNLDHHLPKDNQNNPEHTVSRYLDQHKLQPRKAHFRNIYNSQGSVIDQCILLYYPPEHSYNSEQIIQFHVHGSKAIVASLFKQLKSKGFRMADRGEFTKRALINGKISLVQAQSINDLIKSQNQFERQIAINNMLGKGKQFLQDIKKQLIKCLANNEAYIDFQQDQSDVKSDLFIKNKQVVKNVIKNINRILQNYKNLQIIKQGINITIIGKPNVGKSTLINALSKKQVAIVSQQPGTTRDILQTQIQCGGVLVNLYDTAGLRETGNKIQSQGIRRAKLKAEESQINLFIIDIEQEQTKQHILQNGEKEIQIVYNVKQNNAGIDYNSIISKNMSNTIMVINKRDKLPPQFKNCNKFYIYIKKHTAVSQKAGNQQNEQCKTQQSKAQYYKFYADLIISAQWFEQVNKLSLHLQQKVKQKYSLYKTSEQIYFTRERYFDKLTTCSQYLQKYLQQQRSDIACQYLRNSIQQISQIFGKVDVEDVLDVLFKQFCIGK